MNKVAPPSEAYSQGAEPEINRGTEGLRGRRGCLAPVFFTDKKERIMSESLPGYDEWKTTDPRDYEPEEPPLEEDPDDARDRLIEDRRLRDEEPDDDIEF